MQIDLVSAMVGQTIYINYVLLPRALNMPSPENSTGNL